MNSFKDLIEGQNSEGLKDKYSRKKENMERQPQFSPQSTFWQEYKLVHPLRKPFGSIY